MSTKTVSHTPGPWNWTGTRGNPGLYAYLQGPNFTQVIAAPSGVSVGSCDARLITAAPELLEALIEALPWVEANLDDPVNKPRTVRAVAERVRAAIAKAEGRS